MHVMHRDTILDGVIAKFVGRSVTHAWLETAAGEPHREAGQMMISAVALSHRRATELRAEHDDRVLEHVALLEIEDQRGDALIDFLGRAGDMIFHRTVMIPVAVIKLNEPHTPFGQSPREQT